LLGTLSDLTKRLKSAEGEFDDLGDEAKKAGKEVKKAGTSAKGAGSKMAGMAGKVGALAGGMIAAAVTLEAAKKGFEFLKASVEAAAESNTVMAGNIASVSSNLNEMQVALGEAVAGGEAGNELFALFNATLDFLKGAIDRNKDAIQEFVRRGIRIAISAVEIMAEKFNDLEAILFTLKTGFIVIKAIVLDFAAKAITAMVPLMETFSGLFEVIGAQAQKIVDSPIFRALPTSIQETFQSVANFGGDATDAMVGFANSASDMADEADGEALVALAGYDEGLAEIRASGDETAEAIETFREGLDDGTIAANQAERGVTALAAAVGSPDDAPGESLAGNMSSFNLMMPGFALAMQQMAEMAVGMQAKIMEDALFNIELMEEIKLQEAAVLQAAADRAVEAEEEKQDRIASIAGDIGSLSAGLMADGFDAGFTGKDFGKEALKSIGDFMAKKGQALLVQGGVDLALSLFNPKLGPQGGAEIAGGAALIAAGKGLGGIAKSGKGGGGGSPAKAAPASSAGSVKNVTLNSSVSMGFVGDRRSAARELQSINENTASRGL
jgi:hypothetical protein